MDWPVIIAVAGALTLAFALQGAVGFGSGLLAIPLIVWAGLNLDEAVTVLLTSVFVQTAVSCWQYRHHCPWRTVVNMSAVRIASMPPGVWVLTQIVDAGRQRAKQVIGVALLVIVVTQWLARVKPRQAINPGWMVAAGIAGGLMTGAFGMGGPPLVLWAMAHDWPARCTRSFLWANFLFITPAQLAAMAWLCGWEVIDGPIALGLAMTPVVLVAAAVGVKIGDRLNRHRLRIAAFVILILIALWSILAPLAFG
jgi:uncharacterized membrane protein YfcA